jgi:hypothetical protein
LGAQYLTFGRGATSATCAKTAAWNPRLLMPHAARQLAGADRVHFERPRPRPETYTVCVCARARGFGTAVVHASHLQNTIVHAGHT